MQDLAFVGSSQDDIRQFPEDARREAGYQLDKVQRGEQPTDLGPMTTISSGVYEVRIKEHGDEFRVFYVTAFRDKIYVLHAFQKKSRKTSQQDLNVGRRRYRMLKEHLQA